MSYTIIQERAIPQRHLWVPRYQPVRFVEVHATRGNNTPESQYRATINWQQSPANNQGGWGGSCSYVVGRRLDECAQILTDDQMPTYSAGYGGAGTWSIDEFGISVELGQSPAGEAYTDWQYEALARICADAFINHGVPVQFVEPWSQRGPVPSGYVRHDRCENGVKLGKSDPGPAFDEARLIDRVHQILGQGEDDMFTEEDRERMKLIDKRLGGDGTGNGLEPFAGRIEPKIDRLLYLVGGIALALSAAGAAQVANLPTPW